MRRKTLAYSTKSLPPIKTSAWIDFFKYQAAGNDFILIEGALPTNLSSLCNRHYGIGSDGVILLEPSTAADVKMRFFNPDGKEAGMCGNGLRCVVRHLNRDCCVETKAGILQGKIGQNVTVTMPHQILDQNLVYTGTRHLVVFAKDFSEFHTAASLRQKYAANVNFAVVDSEVHIRTFEMGVEGETLACGTGAAAVATLLGKDTTVIHVSGEKSHFSWENNHLWMEGPAEFVFAGKILLV